MARLYQFILSKEGFKSTFDDFLIQSQNGLSASIHKGWLSVKKSNGSLYEMNFTTTHPLKLRNGLSVLAYVQYPNNTLDKILYALNRNGADSLPMVEYMTRAQILELKAKAGL